MPTFRVEVKVHTADIAQHIATSERRKDAHEFIMLIDELVADYDFTKNLIKELQESLKREDETTP